MQKFVLTRSFASMLRGLDNDTALCGPGGDPDRTVVDDIMGTPFVAALADYRLDAEVFNLDDFIRDTLCVQDPILEVNGEKRTIIIPALTAYGEEIGALALTENASGGFHVTGCFSGSGLSVDPAHQGNGIGRALTLARLMTDEQLPTWDHHKPGYSPAGVETVRSAVNDLKNICEHINGEDAETPYALIKYKIDVEIEGVSPCP